MQHQQIDIRTADGAMPTHVLQPDGNGAHPLVIVYMDAVGVRPALLEIAERIAGDGYFVLLPDLFYRVEWDSSQGLKLFTDPEFRKDLFTRVMPSASHANVMRDTEAMLTYAKTQRGARVDSLGITGYCMGGRVALYAAGHFGTRIAAVGAYHPGGVATDAPDSPHRLAPGVRARLYIGRAIDDPGFDDAQKARLEMALDGAGVAYTIETYNARHGFVPRDTPVHDDAAEARHWETLLGLFESTLKSPA